MKRITRPTHSVRPTLDLCVSRIENDDLKARTELVADDLEAGESDYSEQANQQSLYAFEEHDQVGQLTRDEMVSLYDDRLSKKGHPAREIYDSLRASAKFNICPLCGQRQVASLDHYLPKSSHPLFAITPINLVPCCSDCNKAKLAEVGTDAASQTFHPYFDDFDDGVWLVACVVEENPPAVLFSVASPEGWNEIKVQRATHHFSLLGLAELYGSNAAQELAQIAQCLKELLEASGRGEVQRHLEHQAASRCANSRNSWQAAMYAALARSEWFCRSGLLTIRT
jgi:hypothetical protein